MLSVVHKILSFQMTIAEWIGTAVILVIPYLAIGVGWLAFHTDHINDGDAVHRIVLILATIASWPVLLVSNVCLT
jgi:hypothetical protein